MADSDERIVRAPAVRIGEWTFDRSAAMLTRGGERRRLEHRAAEVLHTLAQHRGSIVSHKQLVDRVWSGRSVSQNSVAIAIADLRRALGDEAKSPRFIETVPKRGYRLAGEHKQEQSLLLPMLAAVGLIAVLALALLQWRSASTSATPISVAAFSNATGSSTFEPLTVSTRELVVTDLGAMESVELQPTGRGPKLRFTGKLIMWSGHPALAMSVEEPSENRVVWTGMASGPENELPRQVHAALASFAAAMRQRGP